MKILLTGATGYIGSKLTQKLIAQSHHQIRVFVRNATKLPSFFKDAVEVFEGDTFQPDALNRALKGIDLAYYLIHSMQAKDDFERLDRLSAQNFREASIDAGVKRIVYLGGLGTKETASKHLLSRIETGEILSEKPGRIQTIWFRAAIIIGSGSASFRIIRSLIHRLPLMTTPRWVHTLTQPIGVDNVLDYLEAAIDLKTDQNLKVDIGGETMSFKEMLLRAAKVMGRKRLLITVPLLSPRLSSYWLRLVTHVSFRVAKALVDGLKSETIVTNDNAQKHFPEISLLSYESAVQLALEDREHTTVR